MTTTYRWFLANWAKRLSWKGVAVAFGTTWQNVFRSVKHAVSWGLKHRDLSGIQSLGVDEVQWQKGHKYLTLVYQIDEGSKRLLWIGKDRTAKSFLGEERGKSGAIHLSAIIPKCAGQQGQQGTGSQRPKDGWPRLLPRPATASQFVSRRLSVVADIPWAVSRRKSNGPKRTFSRPSIVITMLRIAFV